MSFRCPPAADGLGFVRFDAIFLVAQQTVLAGAMVSGVEWS